MSLSPFVGSGLTFLGYTHRAHIAATFNGISDYVRSRLTPMFARTTSQGDNIEAGVANENNTLLPVGSINPTYGTENLLRRG